MTEIITCIMMIKYFYEYNSYELWVVGKILIYTVDCALTEVGLSGLWINLDG